VREPAQFAASYSATPSPVAIVSHRTHGASGYPQNQPLRDKRAALSSERFFAASADSCAKLALICAFVFRFLRFPHYALPSATADGFLSASLFMR